ncbi:MAG: coproporphyrinogen-III oxidase family protein [Elusimicrobiota bacterium]
MRDLIRCAEDAVFGEYRYEELKREGLIADKGLFVPSLFYPPLHRYPPAAEEDLLKGLPIGASTPIGVYVHFPFCLKQCVFCHYAVHTTASEGDKDRYLDMLEREIGLFRSRLGVETLRTRSVLVGGGTPTHLSPAQLERFLKLLSSRFSRSPASQISYDVDPSTILGPVGAERLKALRAHGVSRLTMGAQSFDDGLLKKMNRPHTAKDILAAVAQAREAGFRSIGLEFIFGYPGLTLEKWAQTLRAAAAAGVEEVHLYRLKVIPYGSGKGAIVSDFDARKDDYPSEREALVMKELAILMLEEAGYRENLTRVFTKTREDVSGYARDMCCLLADTAGFGLTAISSYRDRHCRNLRAFKEYYDRIERGRLPYEDGKIRSPDEQLRWALIRPLKNWHVDKAVYKRTTGTPLDSVFRAKIGTLKKHGLLEEDAKKLVLTRKGRFFADEVCHQFYHPDHLPFPKDAYAPGELSPYHGLEPACGSR